MPYPGEEREGLNRRQRLSVASLSRCATCGTLIKWPDKKKPLLHETQSCYQSTHSFLYDNRRPPPAVYGSKRFFNAWLTFHSLPECEITFNYCHLPVGHLEFQAETKKEMVWGRRGRGQRVQLHAGRETHVCPDGAGGLAALQGEGEEG